MISDQFVLLARRGGIFRLVGRAIEGDPVAIGILAVVAVAFVGYTIYKTRTAPEEVAEFGEESPEA